MSNRASSNTHTVALESPVPADDVLPAADVLPVDDVLEDASSVVAVAESSASSGVDDSVVTVDVPESTTADPVSDVVDVTLVSLSSFDCSCGSKQA